MSSPYFFVFWGCSERNNKVTDKIWQIIKGKMLYFVDSLSWGINILDQIDGRKIWGNVFVNLLQSVFLLFKCRNVTVWRDFQMLTGYLVSFILSPLHCVEYVRTLCEHRLILLINTKHLNIFNFLESQHKFDLTFVNVLISTQQCSTCCDTLQNMRQSCLTIV